VWDFDDLDSSETRFRTLLDGEDVAGDRAGILTQLARIEGLRRRFAAGELLLAQAEALGGADGWVLVERGRLTRSRGDTTAALPLFEAAFELAREQGDEFLAGDAVHMTALVGDAEAWTARGIQLARSSDDTAARYWLGPLLSNLGWTRYESGDFSGALTAFEEALRVRADESDRPYPRELARYAVGKTLRALGRLEEATAQRELAVAWAAAAGIEMPYVHEELAECYAADGRPDAARAQATRALKLLHEAEEPAARIERLRLLSVAPPPANDTHRGIAPD
jgi:tetratricopeptide (TPR) repeat protein